MDPFIEKVEELKREAELVKQTCPCQSNATTVTPPRSNKRKSKKGANANAAGGQLPNGICSPSPSNVQASSKVSFEGEGDGDWISAFKTEAGVWTGKPLVVLSLFDGLGGIWQSLTNLGIPFSGYSSEVLGGAIEVVKARHPHVKHVGDVTKLQLSAIPEKVDLVVGGFPCQDLSIMGKKEG